MRLFFVLVVFFSTGTVLAGGSSASSNGDNVYAECNLVGLQDANASIRKINSVDLVEELSLEQVVYELVDSYREELSALTVGEEKLTEPDYIEQVLDLLDNQLHEDISCFTGMYEPGYLVYRFSQKVPGRVAKGYAIADGKLKAVLYTLVLND